MLFRHFRGHLYAEALLAVGLVTLFAAIFPQHPAVRQLTTTMPFAQFVAFLAPVSLCVCVLGVVLAVLAHYPVRSFRLWVASVVWIISGIIFALAPAGFYFPERAPAIEAQAAAADDGAGRSIRIMTFNTQGAFTKNDLETIFSEYDPDILVLPETPHRDLVRYVADLDYPGYVRGTPPWGRLKQFADQVAPTTVIVNNRLGHSRLVEGPITRSGTVSLEFDDPGLPRIIGLHTASPKPGLMDVWRADLNRSVAYGEDFDAPIIMAGDFNATLRHGPMARRSALLDAARQCDHFPGGTWPAASPASLRAQIDHVFITAPLQATDCAVHRIGDSDHAAFITTIRVPETA
ncbi:endonuclease/exonuclease/phosphatase family protein [Corynebacterium sp. TAE3-ERU12]|uniref:endonuclease/exonuclease/phosphatase family protein n=1 Tax=Corynebacterium sp. TAE3-ERU12 TaxID=2849491 RepID=UPI001C491519|nr:endonuclease/exonuclease/phosphatase family protein [Corynebacterium sp. TAE3-ERU12]MBV7295491.1 endonuclease/exonuclease/phosphatase family protein [Corynebacterium sp. TAE3-ERU12]